MTKPLIVVLVDTKLATRVIAEDTWRLLDSFAEVRGNAMDRPLQPEEARELLAGAMGCLTGWGSKSLTEEVLRDAPDLKIVAHSAGSVRPIVSDALWDRGVLVTSASDAIAYDVAETTIALMVISIKRIWQLAKHTREGGWSGAERDKSREMNGKTIGIIGASNVGMRVMNHLKNYSVHVLLYDPYCSDEKAASFGAKLVSLETLLRESDIVSVHAPNTQETHHMLNEKSFALMKDGAILTNTARGALIDEAALAAECASGRLFACIDVTDPEPPAADSPLRTIDNIVLIPHIAGVVTNCTRLGAMAAEELRRHFAGEPPMHPITKEMMTRIG